MRDLIRFWRAEIDRNWIVAAVLVVFLITASFNCRMGYEIGGGADEFPLSLGYGLVFVGLAVLGAYGFAQAGSVAGGKRSALIAVGIIQLAVGLQAGWQSLGLTLSKGAAGLETKASLRQTFTDDLRKARAQREALGVTRAVSAIAADEVLECRRTSQAYKDGVGPACTKLRGELASAKLAVDLDKRIPELQAQLADAPRIKDANANFEVAMSLASSARSWWTGKPVTVSSDDARFWFLVFMVAVLEIVGVLGFWIAGVHGGGNDRGGRSPFDGHDDVSAPEGFLPPHALFAPIRQLPAPPRRMAIAADAGLARATTSAAQLGPDGNPLTAGGGTAGGGHNTLAGAPINLTLNMGGAGITPAASTSQPPDIARTGEPAARSPRHDVGIVPDIPPADRGAVNALTDNLLAFKAACIVVVSGGHVTATDLYRRYVAWRGAGALVETAFHGIFPTVADVPAEAVGGQLHYRGVALRAASVTTLRSVAVSS